MATSWGDRQEHSLFLTFTRTEMDDHLIVIYNENYKANIKDGATPVMINAALVYPLVSTDTNIMIF